MISSPQRLLDIDDALVSETNPARGNSTLDVERCVRLHNYLVARGWMAQHNKEPDDLGELLARPSFFELYGDEAESIRDRLGPALAAFLGSIITPDQDDSYLFFWVSRLSHPADMLNIQDFFLLEEDEVNGLPHFVLLYPTVVEMGSHTVGLVYDQERHRVALPFVLEYIESVSPVEEHLEMWHPLETMLSNWINLIRIGKVVAKSPDNNWPSPVMGVCQWQSYGAAQIDSAVAAFDQLTAAIEARIPTDSLLQVDRDKPLLTDADLDAASVPANCFVRSLLTQVKTPRFTAIAPGLEVPRDASAFAARQKFTVMPSPGDGNGPLIPPVLIFAAADTNRTVNFDTDDRYTRLNPFSQDVPHGDHSTPAGLYSESVNRLEIDTAEEGFRLLLPFQLRVNDLHEGGARKSDGSLISRGSIAELFQHGFKPFGGEFRAQRLERLLDRWRELVEDDIWKVGQHGVEGTIDTFRDADNGARRDYWIPPDW